MKEIQCIYAIKNTNTNQYYVGSTVNYWKRIKDHKNRLKRNCHHSYLLQDDYNICSNCFDFLILEKVVDSKNLIKQEQEWIDKLNPYYNICKIADRSLGVKRRDITKKRKSESEKGRKHPEWRNKIKSESQRGENHWTKHKKFSEDSKKKMSESQKKLYEMGYENPKAIKIGQYDLQDNLIKIWNSANEASKELNIEVHCIYNCSNNRSKTSNGFKWIKI